MQTPFGFGQQFPIAYKHDGLGGAKWLALLGDRVGGRRGFPPEKRFFLLTYKY
jgi:hypothetical protein